MKKTILLSFLAVMVLGVSVVKACEVVLPTQIPTVTPSMTPEPSATPEPSQTPMPTYEPTPSPSETPVETPVETPTPTQEPAAQFSDPAPASAPELPLCPVIEQWIPTVYYHGQTIDVNGNSVFHYTWSTVESNYHVYKVEYGFTKEFMPYHLFTTKEEADITMFGGNTNWMKVALYKEPGCTGKWSEKTN